MNSSAQYAPQRRFEAVKGFLIFPPPKEVECRVKDGQIFESGIQLTHENAHQYNELDIKLRIFYQYEAQKYFGIAENGEIWTQK